MLTGRRAFGGDSVAETLVSTLKEEPDYEALPPDVPPTIRLLLKRCLRKKPGERLRDIGDARILLEDAGELQSSPVAGPSRDRSGARPWQLSIVVAAAMLAAVLAWTLKPGPPDPTTRKLDLVARDVEWEWHTAPALAPGGNRIAYNARGGIWVRDLDDVAPRMVAEVYRPVSLFWSSDGQHLGYFSQRALWRVPADGGRPVQICSLPRQRRCDRRRVECGRHDRLRVVAWGVFTPCRPRAAGRSFISTTSPGKLIDYHTPFVVCRTELCCL